MEWLITSVIILLLAFVFLVPHGKPSRSTGSSSNSWTTPQQEAYERHATRRRRQDYYRLQSGKPATVGIPRIISNPCDPRYMLSDGDDVIESPLEDIPPQLGAGR